MSEPAFAVERPSSKGPKPHPIRLFGSVPHELPKMIGASRGWLRDETTMEIQLATEAGHCVLLPLGGAAIEDLVDLLLQASRSKDEAVASREKEAVGAASPGTHADAEDHPDAVRPGRGLRRAAAGRAT